MNVRACVCVRQHKLGAAKDERGTARKSQHKAEVCPLYPCVSSRRDSIQDSLDNCPNDVNSDQGDVNADGVGDVCDLDADSDGILSAFDNCPLVPNVDQNDMNADGVGDACALDFDGDGHLDANDICPKNSVIFEQDLGSVPPPARHAVVSGEVEIRTYFDFGSDTTK